MISDEYKDLLMEKHEAKPWGGAGKSWIPWILPLLNNLPPGKLQVLDYGCGRGTLKKPLEEMNPDVQVLEYDPGVAGKTSLPQFPVDYVVCTDVMEHVEEEWVPHTLKTINWLAIHGVFFNIDMCESKSFLPDGRNTHITIKPAKWWYDKLNEHMPGLEWRVHEEKKCRLVISGRRVASE
jgi:hypothetical protein